MKLKFFTLFLTIFLIIALVPIALADAGDKSDVNTYCTSESGRQHPVGSRIAFSFGIEYSDVMDWFCNGNYGFGEILLALQTSRLSPTEETPERLLQMKTELGGWGEVWKSLGFTGRPKADRSASGPPIWAGTQNNNDEISGDGPPAWAGPKDKSGEKGKGGPPQWAGPKYKIGPVEIDEP